MTQRQSETRLTRLDLAGAPGQAALVQANQQSLGPLGFNSERGHWNPDRRQRGSCTFDGGPSHAEPRLPQCPAQRRRLDADFPQQTPGHPPVPMEHTADLGPETGAPGTVCGRLQRVIQEPVRSHEPPAYRVRHAAHRPALDAAGDGDLHIRRVPYPGIDTTQRGKKGAILADRERSDAASPAIRVERHANAGA